MTIAGYEWWFARDVVTSVADAFDGLRDAIMAAGEEIKDIDWQLNWYAHAGEGWWEQ